MTRAEALAELRSVIDDTVAPYAWSDARLMQFLALGQTQFCRDTGFFRDSTNYPLVTQAGISSYALAPEIIQVLAIKMSPYAELVPGFFPDDTTQGQPYGWRLGNDTGNIELFPVPDGVYTLTMKVWRSARVPFDRTTNGIYDGEFEIPSDFHFAPVEWAAYKCFGDHDRERQDPVKAADHLANYKGIVKDGKTAFRRMHGEMIQIVPNPSYVV